MASTRKDQLTMPLIQQYNKSPELSVSHIYRLRPEELSLLFRKEHLDLPLNQGEKRESLIILEKVGLYEGLLKSLGTDGLTGIIGDEKDIKRR